MAGAVAAVGIGVGSFFVVSAASAMHGITASPQNPVYWTCHNNKTGANIAIRQYNGSNEYPVCGPGYAKWFWNQQGPAGANGTNGTNGKDATFSTSGQTAITAWPEGSGWANDAMTRAVTITRESAAPSADCGGTPECWFYKATLTDNGTFTTVAGHASPNSSSKAVIPNAYTGSMIGGAKVEFYASTDNPDGALLPATATGTKKPASTTDWVELAFPSGTTFKSLSLTQYAWVYSLPQTCEKWTDAINPGDDGQGTNDGNITGVLQTGCTAPTK